MMSISPIVPSDPLLAALAAGQRLLAAGTNVTVTSAVNRERIDVDVPEVNAVHLDDLLAQCTTGHSLDVTISTGGLMIVVRAEGAARPSLDVTGDAGQALDADKVDELRIADINHDARGALTAAGQLPAHLRFTVHHNPTITGYHWIRTVTALVEELSTDRWAAALNQIEGDVTAIVIQDAQAVSIRGSNLLLCGPDADRATAPPPPPAAATHDDDRDPLPHPNLLAELEHPQAPLGTTPATLVALQTLVGRLNGLARILVWYHLANRTSLERDGQVYLRIDGARTVELKLKPADTATSPAPDVALYRWATSAADPALTESAVHAATLAIVTLADLDTAATPALRTAKSLYELSRRGAVTEALATRRSARAVTTTAARAAAEAARTVASKATERALLQAVAATAVILSNSANIIGRAPAALVLLLIIAFTSVSLWVGVRQDLPVATATLDAELLDLEQYREALAAADIEQIKKLETITVARDQLTRARNTTVRVYLVTIVAIAAVGGGLIVSHQTPKANPLPATTPSPTPTGSSPASAPAQPRSTPALSPTTVRTAARSAAQPPASAPTTRP